MLLLGVCFVLNPLLGEFHGGVNDYENFVSGSHCYSEFKINAFEIEDDDGVWLMPWVGDKILSGF